MITETWAIIIGIVSGVAAAIPTSLILLVILTRQTKSHYHFDSRLIREDYPPIIIIHPGELPARQLPKNIRR